MHPVQFADLVEERRALWRDIDQRERTRREAGEASCVRDLMASEDALLFERLLRLCQKISQVQKSGFQTP